MVATATCSQNSEDAPASQCDSYKLLAKNAAYHRIQCKSLQEHTFVCETFSQLACATGQMVLLRIRPSLKCSGGIDCYEVSNMGTCFSYIMLKQLRSYGGCLDAVILRNVGETSRRFHRCPRMRGCNNISVLYDSDYCGLNAQVSPKSI
eukprot:Gb_21210 [translate_table: standard]